MREYDEEDIFKKYLAKGYSLWGRIKFWWFLFRMNLKARNDRARTVKDVVTWDAELFYKMVAVLMALVILQYLGNILVDIWFWIFPRKVWLPTRFL